ncbi:unnamed protein product [Alternaria alternata]
MTDPAPLQPAPLPVPQGLGLLVPQAETFLVEGLYIGLLSRHQPPTEVREWFDDNRVCEMLKAHVKRKNKSTVYLTAIVLCMAGKLDGVEVMLTPTIWISGGDKKSKSSIKSSISNLSYLNRFLARFQMREPHVTVSGPEILSGVRISSGAGVHTFEIRAADESLDSVCGTSARFTMEAASDGSTFKSYTTIGGLILVDGDLFAITTAHAITKYAIPDPRHMVTDRTDDSPMLRDLDMLEWKPSPFPSTFAYLGDAYVRGVKVDRPLVDAADFALVEPQSFPNLGFNTYQLKDRSHFESVSDYTPTSELKSGDVTICTNDDTLPMKGIMVKGDAPIIVGGVAMLTRMIEVTTMPSPGLSGSWVVREGKLCGVVYAGSVSIPYLYIIPAEIMLEDRILARLVNYGTPQEVAEEGFRVCRVNADLRAKLDKVKKVAATTAAVIATDAITAAALTTAAIAHSSAVSASMAASTSPTAGTIPILKRNTAVPTSTIPAIPPQGQPRAIKALKNKIAVMEDALAEMRNEAPKMRECMAWMWDIIGKECMNHIPKQLKDMYHETMVVDLVDWQPNGRVKGGKGKDDLKNTKGKEEVKVKKERASAADNVVAGVKRRGISPLGKDAKKIKFEQREV